MIKRLKFLSAVCFILLAGLATGCTTNVQAAQAPTLQPTETAVPITTPTALPDAAPIEVPEVDWDSPDVVAAHKQAMKPGFEADVDRFAKGNRYLIVASLDLSNDAIIRGAERVRYTNHSADTLDIVVFRLYPNGPTLGGRSTVSSVTVNGIAVEPSLSALRSVMGVPLPTPLAPGESAEFVINFAVVMTRNLFTAYGRFGYVNRVVSSTSWYPTLSVYEPGRGWWAEIPNPNGDPGYSETGLYDVRMTVPADVTVVMSGTVIAQTDNGDGTITYRDVTGPMRDHAFQASPRYMITSQVVDGTTINVVHYADRAGLPTDGTQDALKFGVQSVEIFNHIFGEYPYKELDIVQNPTPSGVEFPGLIQIAQAAWTKGQPYLEIVIAHEVGHQWFYGLVGNNQVDHPWIDESLTSFTEIVYMREVYNNGKKAQDHEDSFKSSYNGYTGSGQPDQPLNLPVSSYGDAAYGAIIYRKGPVFYTELERLLGRDVVYRALNVYFERFKYQIAVSSDVENVFEEVSGKDLSALFRQWVGVTENDGIPSTRLGYFINRETA